MRRCARRYCRPRAKVSRGVLRVLGERLLFLVFHANDGNDDFRLFIRLLIRRYGGRRDGRATRRRGRARRRQYKGARDANREGNCNVANLQASAYWDGLCPRDHNGLFPLGPLNCSFKGYGANSLHSCSGGKVANGDGGRAHFVTGCFVSSRWDHINANGSHRYVMFGYYAACRRSDYRLSNRASAGTIRSWSSPGRRRRGGVRGAVAANGRSRVNAQPDRIHFRRYLRQYCRIICVVDYRRHRNGGRRYPPANDLKVVRFGFRLFYRYAV